MNKYGSYQTARYGDMAIFIAVCVRIFGQSHLKTILLNLFQTCSIGGDFGISRLRIAVNIWLDNSI